MKKLLLLMRKYEDIVLYLFFGVMTTLINFLVYFPMYNFGGCSGFVSNIVAWIVAVTFAFLTNKPFVFKSHDWSAKVLYKEASKFVGCRIASGLLETLSVWLFVDIMSWNGNLVKVIVSILVVILNYIFSKWIVFVKKEKV